MTTKRLYYGDSYLTDFEAAIIDLADGGRRVYLDRTAFYPTSGGQPFDTGRLGNVPVVEVVDEEDRIAHLVAEPMQLGPIRGVVDWPRRFDHMQQHTGQHLLSAVLAETFGYRTVSVHFGTDLATLDLDAGSISTAEIRRVESRANAVVTENRQITVEMEEAALATGLRKPSDRTGPIRVVSIAGLDRSACGGTHVRSTGEIGAVHIRKADRVKKQVRLEFLCGARATERARADFEVLSTIASATSAAIDDLPALVQKQRAELRELEAGRRAIEEALSGFRARDLYHAAPLGPTGRRCLVHRAEPGELESLRSLAQAIVALPKAVLIAAIAAPPTVLIASSADSGVDAGQTLKAVLAEIGGRGGGSGRLAQGTVPGSEELETALAKLASAVSAAP